MLRLAQVSAQIHRGLIALITFNIAPPAIVISTVYILQVGLKFLFRVENYFAQTTAVQGMYILQVLVDMKFCYEFATYNAVAVTYCRRPILISLIFRDFVFITDKFIKSFLER